MVIIVPGSGKDTRHSHYFLAENLLRNNIAVFRFDELGVGESQGNFDPSATSLESPTDFAFRTLRKMPVCDHKKIGVLGHSLGGFASIFTYEANRKQVDFLIQMAAPVKNLADNFVWRAKRADTEFFFIEGRKSEEVAFLLENLYRSIFSYRDLSYKEIREKAIENGISIGFKKREILKFLMGDQISHITHENIDESYKTVEIPMLYLIGSSDQIIDYKSNTGMLTAFENKNVTVRVEEGLNHWLTKRNAVAGTSLYDMDEAPMNAIVSFVKSL